MKQHENNDAISVLDRGDVAKYSSVGCYPLFYLDVKVNVICAECVDPDLPEGDADRVVSCHVNYEDPCLYCVQCSERIESAYAEDES